MSIRGDNWLGIHEAGLLRVAGFHRGCEAVDAHFSSGIFATPYCVLVDHEWRCVVISIRGTMSLEDCVYDLHAEPASIEEYGRKWGFDGRGVFTHQVWGRGTTGVDGMFREGRGERGRGTFSGSSIYDLLLGWRMHRMCYERCCVVDFFFTGI